MFSWLRHLFGWILGALGSRTDLMLENLALREQLLALHAERPRRRLSPRHQLFRVALRRLWLATIPYIRRINDLADCLRCHDFVKILGCSCVFDICSAGF